ncbi:MAG: hypothetical protein B6242_17330 [Anaerolineaceae bacterium 4572_78]|nr:MAG: hypothetical protein B6242_17330 [Anaerolineaceae bacterium 4572_78]
MSAIEFSKQVYPEINVAYQGDITYTISISNLSASTISDIMMTDTLPTSVTFDAWLNNQTADYGDTVMNTADYDSPVGMGSDSASFNVQYEPIEAPLVINEVDADTPGTETEEFVELYDGGVGNTPLDGLVIVVPDTYWVQNGADAVALYQGDVPR